jgi:hypothetical protein
LIVPARCLLQLGLVEHGYFQLRSAAAFDSRRLLNVMERRLTARTV